MYELAGSELVGADQKSATVEPLTEDVRFNGDVGAEAGAPVRIDRARIAVDGHVTRALEKIPYTD